MPPKKSPQTPRMTQGQLTLFKPPAGQGAIPAILPAAPAPVLALPPPPPPPSPPPCQLPPVETKQATSAPKAPVTVEFMWGRIQKELFITGVRASPYYELGSRDKVAFEIGPGKTKKIECSAYGVDCVYVQCGARWQWCNPQNLLTFVVMCAKEPFIPKKLPEEKSAEEK